VILKAIIIICALPENGKNIIPFWGDASVAGSQSQPWTRLIASGSAPVQMSGCCLGGALS